MIHHQILSILLSAALLSEAKSKEPTSACVSRGIKYTMGARVPHYNPCLHCTCSRLGVKCNTIRCQVIPCSPMQLPVFKPGECSKGCKDAACLQNGKTFMVGQVMAHPHPCTRCLCTTNGKVCRKVNCPKRCPTGYKSIPRYRPYPNASPQCCACVPDIDGCVDAGKKYIYGSKMPYYGDKPCYHCLCTEKGKHCHSTVCRQSCSKGKGRNPTKTGECCQNCESLAKSCIEDGVVYSVGSSMPTWLSERCVSCRCTKTGKQCQRTRCRSTLPCAPGNNATSSSPWRCCPTCDPWPFPRYPRRDRWPWPF